MGVSSPVNTSRRDAPPQQPQVQLQDNPHPVGPLGGGGRMPRRGRGSSLHALLPAGCPPPGPYVALGTWKTRMPRACLALVSNLDTGIQQERSERRVRGEKVPPHHTTPIPVPHCPNPRGRWGRVGVHTQLPEPGLLQGHASANCRKVADDPCRVDLGVPKQGSPAPPSSCQHAHS